MKGNNSRTLLTIKWWQYVHLISIYMKFSENPTNICGEIMQTQWISYILLQTISMCHNSRENFLTKTCCQYAHIFSRSFLEIYLVFAKIKLGHEGYHIFAENLLENHQTKNFYHNMLASILDTDGLCLGHI